MADLKAPCTTHLPACREQSPKELLADWRRMFTPAMHMQVCTANKWLL